MSLTKFLKWLVQQTAFVHDGIVDLCDRMTLRLSDKDLHFLVMGLLGALLMAVIYPLFKWLNRRGKVFAISWIYAFTLMLAICFAIEIGQRFSHTGTMEMGDVVSGMQGFLAATAVIVVLRMLWHIIRAGIAAQKKNRR